MSDTTPRSPPNVVRRRRPRNPLDDAPVYRDERPARRNDKPRLAIRLLYLIPTFLFTIVYGYYYLNPMVFHQHVVKVAEHLPTSINEWLVEHHGPKAGIKAKKLNVNDEDETGTKNRQKHDWMKGPSTDPALKIFSMDDIKYTEGGPMFLVLIGHVFDVTGSEYYKPGSGYHAFIGQDASRSFVTGEFSKDALTDDLVGMQAGDYTGLANWLKFYLDHETYKFVGYLDGKYFDEYGMETEAMSRLKSSMKWAELESEKEGDLLKLFPSCNVEWKAGEGSTLWCSTKSGGVDRDWVGYPRKFFEKPEKSPRCACVHPNYLADPRVQLYDDCKSDSDICKLPETVK